MGVVLLSKVFVVVTLLRVIPLHHVQGNSFVDKWEKLSIYSSNSNITAQPIKANGKITTPEQLNATSEAKSATSTEITTPDAETMTPVEITTSPETMDPNIISTTRETLTPGPVTTKTTETTDITDKVSSTTIEKTSTTETTITITAHISTTSGIATTTSEASRTTETVTFTTTEAISTTPKTTSISPGDTTTTPETTNTASETTITITPIVDTTTTEPKISSTTEETITTRNSATSTTNTETSEESTTDSSSPLYSSTFASTSVPVKPTTTPGQLTKDEILEGIKEELQNITLSLEKLEDIVTSVPTIIETVSTDISSEGHSTDVPVTEEGKGLKSLPVFSSEEEICTPMSADNDTDLCVRTIAVLNQIEEFSESFTENDIVEQDLLDIQLYSQELFDIVCEMDGDVSFVQNQINPEAFIGRLHDVDKAVERAIVKVDDMLRPPKKNNLKVILLGTIGGIVGVALLTGAAFMIHKKRKNSKKRDSFRGDTNEGYIDDATRKAGDSQGQPAIELRTEL
ncbi:hypothetical protein SK128_023484 [Halocaridina rubra]|uniref:Uncharacterized protein n=1 Tax=Halocaridina rubra TaxID=373956 RepID=A0AAN9AF40_HALRR